MDRIKITIVKDFIDLSDSDNFCIDYQAQTIAEIKQDFIKEDGVNYSISINGHVIPPEKWDAIPKRGQHIIFVPRPETFGLGEGALASFIWGMIISMVVTAAVNVAMYLLMPTPDPTTDPISTGNTTQTYSWQSQTLQQQGPHIPRIYGKIPNNGNIIGAYLENVGASQYLHILLCLGLGPVSSLENFKINDQPIAYYPGVEVDYRLGLLNQSCIPAFADTKIETIATHVIANPLTWTGITTKYAESSTRTADMVLPTVPNGRVYRVASVEGPQAPIYAPTGPIGSEPTWPVTEDFSGTVFDGILATQKLVDGTNYTCIKNHTSSVNNRPGTGINWETYWIAAGDAGTNDWAAGHIYLQQKGVNWIEAGLHPYVYTTLTSNFTGLEIDISALKGIYMLSEGTVVPRPVDVRVEVKASTSSIWTTISRRVKTWQSVSYNGKWSAGHWITQSDGRQIWEELQLGTTSATAHQEGDAFSYTFPADEDGYVYGLDRYFWHWVSSSIVKGLTFENTVRIMGKSTNIVRRTVKCYDLTEGSTYDIRMTKITPDRTNSQSAINTITFTIVRSVITDDFQYPRHVLVAINALARESLSGSLKFSCTVNGSIVQVYDFDTSTWSRQWSDDPAWVDYDVLTRPVLDNNYNVCRYDGVDPDNIILADFEELTDFCAVQVDDGKGTSTTENRATFNGTFDTDLSVWNAAKTVEKIARFVHIWNGTDIGLSIEKAKTPNQLFTVNRNILNKTLKESFVGTQDLYSSIEVQFKDMDDNYSLSARTVFNQDLPNKVNSQVSSLVGCVKQSEAWRYADWVLSRNKNVYQKIEFVADTDALVSVVGDAIYVQPDDPTIGEGGGIGKSSTLSTINLDHYVTLATATTYLLTIRLTDETLGQSLETRRITNSPGSINSATVATPFSVAPTEFDPYTIWTAPLIFTITDIEENDDTHVTIYVENYYVYSDGIPDTTTPPGLWPYATHVADFTLANMSHDVEGEPVRDIEVNFTLPPFTRLEQANIWYRIMTGGIPGTWTLDGSTTSTKYTVEGVTASTVYQVCITTGTDTSVDPDAQIKEITTDSGEASDSDAPTAFAYSIVGRDLVLQWVAPVRYLPSGYNLYLNDVLYASNITTKKYTYPATLTAGDYAFAVKIVDSEGNEGIESALLDISVLAPDTPSPSVSIVGELAVVSWANCATFLPIDYYKMNGVNIGNTLGYSERINWVGEKAFSVVAVDTAGNESSAGSVSLTTTALTTPTGISTKGLTYAIQLTFTYATFSGFSELEIWSNTSNDRTTASKVGATAATSWAHNGLALVDTRYYWIRTKDVYDNYGNWYPASASGGVQGLTSTNPADYLEILNTSNSTYAGNLFISGTIGGVTAVGLNGILVVDETIFADAIGANRIITQSANIATAVIISAHIQSVNADTINAGSIRGINVQGSSHVTKGTYLTASCATAAATLYVKDTTDFATAGTASFIDSANDRDAFTYTGKTSTTLTGCSGVLAHTLSSANIPLVIPNVKSIVMADVVNELRFFGDRGDGTIEELASIGITYTTVYDNILTLGSITNTRRAINAEGTVSGIGNRNNTVIYVCNHSTDAACYGIRGKSYSSTGAGLHGSGGGGGLGGIFEDGINILTGNIEVTAGDITLTNGDVNITLGGITLTDGDITITAGGMVLVDGLLQLPMYDHESMPAGVDGGVCFAWNDAWAVPKKRLAFYDSVGTTWRRIQDNLAIS